MHFTVDQFDFANAVITIDDVIASESAPKHPTKVTNGVKGMENYVELDPSLVDLAFDSAASGSQLFDKAGSYTFAASVDKTNASIKGNADRKVKVNKVAAYADFKYGDTALEDSYFVNLDKKQSFDLDSVKAYKRQERGKGRYRLSRQGRRHHRCKRRARCRHLDRHRQGRRRREQL